MALSRISGTTGIVDGSITSAKLANFSAAVDLNGVELILDADADTSISADTDDQIDIKIANADHLKILSSSGDTVFKPMVDAKDIIFQQFDGNKVFEINDGNFVGVGGNATAAGQIRIYEDTDNGSHYSGFTVGNLTASVAYQLPNADGSSGQQLTTDGSGVLSWAVAGTNPPSADGDSLGTASLEWSDLFLADGGTIQFGNDQEVTLTHVHDTGLLLSATDQLQFGDSGTYIHQSADGVLDLVSDTEIEINATTIDINGNVEISGTTAQTGVLTANAGVVIDNITIDGTEIDLSSGDLTIDVAGDIVLDADGGDVFVKDAGTTYGSLTNTSGNLIIKSGTTTAATFSGANVTFAGTVGSGAITSSAGLVIADAGNIGSASDTDAIAIGSDGDVTLTQDLELQHDGAILSFGANDDVSLTHVHDTGLLLNSTMKIQFNDASQFIHAPSATVLDIGATDEIELTATLIDVVGNATVSGTLGVTGIATFTDDIIIGDGKTIGSASDVDAITIASNGQLTLTQTLIGTALDISGDIDIDGTTNLDIVDIDGAVDMASTLQVDGVITTSDGMIITTADNTDTLSLISTDADANSGPNLRLYRNSGSPADADTVGVVEFEGRNDNSQDVIYSQMRTVVNDVSDGTEDGQIDIKIMNGGSLNMVASFKGPETVINDASIDHDFRVESNGATHMLFVDGGNNGVFVNTDNSAGNLDGASLGVQGGVTFLQTGNSDNLTLLTTDADANVGPNLNLYRNSSSPADNDTLGQLVFVGRNDNSQDFNAFQMTAYSSDVSDGTEDGTMQMFTMQNGSLHLAMQITPTETVFNDSSKDQDFRVESNNGTHRFFVDGGNNVVIVGGNDGSGTVPVPTNCAGGLDPVFQLQGANNANEFTMHISAGINAAGSPPRIVMSKSRDNTLNGNTIIQDDDVLGAITFTGADGVDRNSIAAEITAVVDGTPGENDMPGRLLFLTTADGANTTTERMRIASTGQTTLTSSINDVLFYVKNTATSGNVFGQQINFSSTANDTGSYFFRCLGNNNSTVRAAIYSNGDFDSATNSYGATSDERIKQNITNANSQWNDIKGLKVRNFKLKDEARTEAGGGQAAKTYLGLVAQEAETVSPGLVKEVDPQKSDILSSSEFGTLYTSDDAETQDAVLYTSDDQEVINGEKNVGDIKTPSTKKVGDIKETKDQVKSVSYSVLYMKAIKALQEAMTRIETLETKVTALEG